MGPLVGLIIMVVLGIVTISIVGSLENKRCRQRLMKMNQERLRREEMSYREALPRIWGRDRREPKIAKVPLKIVVGCKKSIICPLCRDDLGNEITECPGCGAMFHNECLEEMGARCSTLGCRKLIDKVRV